MPPKTPWWVTASLIATLVFSVVSLAARFKVEASNKAVGIVMEGQAVHDLAAAMNKPFAAVLLDLRAHGLSGIALTEDTVSELVDHGDVTLSPREGTGIRIQGRPDSLARVAEGLARKGGMGSDPKLSSLTEIAYTGDTRALKAMSVGLDPSDAANAKAAGLQIIARHNNVIGAGPAYIRDLLENSKKLGANAYLPSGEQVLGQRESVEDTAVTLADLGMDYLTPEFAKIGGDSKLSALIPELTIRLHSMQQAEIDKSTPDGVVDRYTKAFRERNVRWLLVRPVTLGGPDALAATDKFLTSLKQGLAQEGGAVKEPRPFTEPGLPKVIFLLIGLACVPWLYWTGTAFVSSPSLQKLGLIVCTGIGALCWLESALPYAALIIGVAAPLTAYCIGVRKADSRHVWLQYLLISAISLVGGLAVAGLLNGLPYYLQVKQALGVKAILLAPVVLIAWLFLNELTSMKEVSAQTIKWGQMLTGLLILGAVAFLVVRSGNDAPSAVSDSEIKVRAILDKVFYTRPRTKEIMIGHPALILGLLLWKRSKVASALRTPAAIALVIGAIGQADIVDTMCHTHTPLDIGVARILIGLIVGGMIGAILWLVTKRWVPGGAGQAD